MRQLAVRRHGEVSFVEQHFLKLLEAPARILRRTALRRAGPAREAHRRAEARDSGARRRRADHGARRTHTHARFAALSALLPFVESIRATLAGDRSSLERLFTVDFAGTVARWTPYAHARIRRSRRPCRRCGSTDADSTLTQSRDPPTRRRSLADDVARASRMSAAEPRMHRRLALLPRGGSRSRRARPLHHRSVGVSAGTPHAAAACWSSSCATGPASRLILIAIEGGDAGRARGGLRSTGAPAAGATRSSPASTTARSLRRTAIANSCLQHRYLLSDAVDARRFSAAGLEAAMRDTIADLASPAGLMLKSLLPHDPTGRDAAHHRSAVAHRGTAAARRRLGVRRRQRALLVAQTAAAGSDTDAQERAIGASRAVPALRHGRARRPAPSGPAALRSALERARRVCRRRASRYRARGRAPVDREQHADRDPAAHRVPLPCRPSRSGSLPVATGALVGIAAVALGFGAVHGITLGFGITLIGESVDYSIYFFIQSACAGQPAQPPGNSGCGPRCASGMLTSVCGFASLLPSGFPGLAQLGAYSISGLLAAAAGHPLRAARSSGRGASRSAIWRRWARGSTTLLRARAPDARGRVLWALRARARRRWRSACCALERVARLWNRELSALSPASPAAASASTRSCAPTWARPIRSDLVVVSGAEPSRRCCDGAERAAPRSAPLIDRDSSAASTVPRTICRASQRRRRGAPACRRAGLLRDNLDRAARGSGARQRSTDALSRGRRGRAPRAACSDRRIFAGTSLAAGLRCAAHARRRSLERAAAAARGAGHGTSTSPRLRAALATASAAIRRGHIGARSEARVRRALRRVPARGHVTVARRPCRDRRATLDSLCARPARRAGAGAAGAGRAHRRRRARALRRRAHASCTSWACC